MILALKKTHNTVEPFLQPSLYISMSINLEPLFSKTCSSYFHVNKPFKTTFFKTFPLCFHVDRAKMAFLQKPASHISMSINLFKKTTLKTFSHIPMSMNTDHPTFKTTNVSLVTKHHDSFKTTLASSFLQRCIALLRPL